MPNYITSVGVQQFSITIANGQSTGTATITAVGSGAFIIYGGQNPSAAGAPNNDFAYLQLTNSTTITATRSGTSGTVVLKGSIIDGDTTNLIKSVQQGTITISSGTSNTASISAVTNANTAVHWMGFSTTLTSGTTIEIFSRLSLSGTTVTASVSTAGATSTIAYEIIEFQSSALTANAVQNVSASSSSNVTSWTAPITSVNTNNAVSIYGGFTTADNVTETMATVMARGSLTNGTTFTVNVNTGVAKQRIMNASIVEFNSGVLNSAVQRGTTTLTGVGSNTSTITAVNTSQAAVSFLGQSATSTGFNYNDSMSATALTAATTATTTKNVSANNVTSSWEIFEFPAFSSGTTVNSWYPAVASAQAMANSALDSVFNPGWPLHLSAPFLPRLPDVASAVPSVGYHTLAMPTLPLRLPIPFLPRLPDVPSAAPPLPQGSVAMNVPRISVLLPWLPRTADAPPIAPADRPNVFAPVFALNFRLPWLATRVADAPPVTPPDKPSFFSPIFPLNFKLPWLPSVAVAPPVTQPDKPNFFSPIFAIVSAITGLPWLPRIADAASLPPADRQAIFSPAFVVNFKLSWFSRVSDAPPVTQPDKPSFFSPTFALNIKLPWLPRIADAAPVTQPDKPNFFSPLFPLNLRLPWLPRISDAPLVLQPDRPSFFAAILPLSLKLLWLPHVSEAAPVTQADKPNFFSPVFATIAVKILSWLPRVSDAPPVTPPDKPNFFFGMIQRIRPAPPTPNRIINPAHDYRTINRP